MWHGYCIALYRKSCVVHCIAYVTCILYSTISYNVTGKYVTWGYVTLEVRDLGGGALAPK